MKNTQIGEPIVSVVCTTYNHEPFIADALESFLMQETSFPFEVIVFDDASTDGTAAIVEKYANANPDIIKPILMKENLYSRKISKLPYYEEASKGKYIAFCEGDDYWTDHLKLQKQVDYMESNPKCTLCIHNSDLYTVSTGEVKHHTFFKESKIIPTEDVILGGGGFCDTNTIMTTRELFFHRPDYFSIMSIDYVLQIYLASQGETYCFKDYMSAYRTGVPGSWTQRMGGRSKAALEKRIAHTKVGFDMMCAFDEATEYKFHDAVDLKKRLDEIYLDELQGKFFKLLNIKRWPLYRKKGLKWTLKTFINAFRNKFAK